tara:strand:- start:3341 stop:3931 length:591 start_codon:yes stop_codon:yes gene_type:complete
LEGIKPDQRQKRKNKKMSETKDQETSAAERLVNNLKDSEAFKTWQKEHQNSFCTHLFLQIKPDYSAMSHWDIGFYDPDTTNVTVFTLNDAGKFEIKQTDDVFATKAQKIEELKLTNKSLDFPSMIPHAQKVIEKEFESIKDLRGNGFAILQSLDGIVTWNISFITKQLTFLNLKLNAESGDKISASNESAIMPDGK